MGAVPEIHRRAAQLGFAVLLHLLTLLLMALKSQAVVVVHRSRGMLRQSFCKGHFAQVFRAKGKVLLTPSAAALWRCYFSSTLWPRQPLLLLHSKMDSDARAKNHLMCQNLSAQVSLTLGWSQSSSHPRSVSVCSVVHHHGSSVGQSFIAYDAGKDR